jgi:Ca2+-binding RTX toxin-like protein
MLTGIASGNGSVGIDHFSGVNNVFGSNQNDAIFGSALDDSLNGGNGGDDTIDGRDGNDNIIGGNGNDTLSGGIGNDTIDGGVGTDGINGGSGNDVITGGGGNDTIIGGAGTDVAVFTGNHLNYTVTASGGVVTVIDNRPNSPDGTDTLTGVEMLRFVEIDPIVGAQNVYYLVDSGSSGAPIDLGSGFSPLYSLTGANDFVLGTPRA